LQEILQIKRIAGIKKPGTKKAMPGEVLPKEMKKTYINSVS